MYVPYSKYLERELGWIAGHTRRRVPSEEQRASGDTGAIKVRGDWDGRRRLIEDGLGKLGWREGSIT